jgi:tetratricopeptide (TPR) repeat protein
MRQLPSDKYNVAWFKLAEFVARGERERALGLYKLLVHSFDDRALAYQLEGDLLLSFHDAVAACQQYRYAAELYKNDARIIEAAAMYEHLITLDPTSKENFIQIIQLYELIGISSHLVMHLERLCDLFIASNEFEQLQFFITEWNGKLEHHHREYLYKQITVALIKKKAAEDIVRYYLKKTIEYLMVNKNSPVLQTFLSTIEALHDKYYYEATAHIQEL